MNMDSLNRWLTLLANLGVIAGIMFLAVELGQNNDLMASQDRYNRLSAQLSNGSIVMQSPMLAEALGKPISDRTPAENRILSRHYHNPFLVWEWSYKELPSDEVPNCLWASSFGGENSQGFWPFLKIAYDPEFVSFMENDLLVGCD